MLSLCLEKNNHKLAITRNTFVPSCDLLKCKHILFMSGSLDCLCLLIYQSFDFLVIFITVLCICNGWIQRVSYRKISSFFEKEKRARELKSKAKLETKHLTNSMTLFALWSCVPRTRADTMFPGPVWGWWRRRWWWQRQQQGLFFCDVIRRSHHGERVNGHGPGSGISQSSCTHPHNQH